MRIILLTENRGDDETGDQVSSYVRICPGTDDASLPINYVGQIYSPIFVKCFAIHPKQWNGGSHVSKSQRYSGTLFKFGVVAYDTETGKFQSSCLLLKIAGVRKCKF